MTVIGAGHGRAVGRHEKAEQACRRALLCLFTQHPSLEEPAPLFPSGNVPSPPPCGVVGTANPRMVTLVEPQGWPMSVHREWPRRRPIAQGRPRRVPLLEFYIQTGGEHTPSLPSEMNKLDLCKPRNI